MKGWKERLSAWSAASAIPLDLVSSLPNIRLSGLHTLILEPHRGIRAFAGDSVLIATAAGLICVRGDGLYLKALSREQLYLCGRIRCVELVDERAV